MSAQPIMVPFVNMTTEDIPPGAVLEPAGGFDGLGRMRMRKCTQDNSLTVWFNSQYPVAGGSMGGDDEDRPGGSCQPAWPAAAAAVHADDLDDFAVLASAGTVSGDWYLRLEGDGFLFVGELLDGMAQILPEPIASAGGGGGGTTITTGNTTSTPSGSTANADTETLKALTTTGVEIKTASGTTRVILNRAATDTQMGAVTITDQVWAGKKTLASTSGQWAVRDADAQPNNNIQGSWHKELEIGVNAFDDGLINHYANMIVSGSDARLYVGGWNNDIPVTTAEASLFAAADGECYLHLVNVRSTYDVTGRISAGLATVQTGAAGMKQLVCSGDFLVDTGEREARYGAYRNSGGVHWGIDATADAFDSLVVTGGIVTSRTAYSAPTITGSRSDPEAALKDLLSKLAAKGLIVDSTSA